MLKRLGIILCLQCVPLWAAQNPDGLWLLGSVYGKKGDFLYEFQPQLRFYEGGTTVDNSVLSLGGGYRWSSRWQFWAGAVSLASKRQNRDNQQEYRLWQQVNWLHEGPGYFLNFRARLEERKRVHFQQISNVFRERFNFIVPLAPDWRMLSYDEFFIRLNSIAWSNAKTLDQNRIYLGVEHQLTQSVRLGLGYLYRTLFREVTIQENVLQLAFELNLDEV